MSERALPVRRAGAGVLVLSVLALAGCGAAATQPAATGSTAAPAPSAKAPVRFAIGYPALSSDFVDLNAGIVEGFFKRNGLNVHLDLLAGSATETSALLSGSVQVVLIDADSALPAEAAGATTEFIGNQVSGFPAQLWAEPSIKTLKDLEGKALGLEHVASLTDNAAHQDLPGAGLNLSKVHLEYLGAPPTEYAALAAHKVPAAVLTSPWYFVAPSKGFHELFDFSKKPHVSQGFLVSQQFAQKDAGEITAFLKSYVETVQWLKAPTNKKAVEGLLAKYAKVKPQFLGETYKDELGHWLCNPTITAANLADAVKYVQKYNHKTVDASKFVDAGPAQSLEKSGFIKQHCG